MKNTSPRLLGVLVALLMLAAACGTSTTTDAAGVTEADDTAQDESTDDAMDDESMEDTAMEDMEMEDGEAVDHGDHDGESHDEEEGHSHDHSAVEEVDAALPIPAVDIELTETDVAGTFVIAVSLENFTITEENVDQDPIDNEGHMHLYVDGERVERFFDLEHEVVVYEGEHLVEVELSANNHSAYAIDGEPIRASATVTGSGEAPVVEEPDASEAAATLTATFAGGSVELDGDERIEVARGDVVMLTVSSDVEEEVHVHGVDIFADVGPGQDAVMVFEATSAGRFEIEFESSGQFIAELVVS